MEQNLTIIEDLRAKLAEKKLDMEMIADLKVKLAAQPPDEETAEALRALLLTQALDEEMMQALTALQREYMPEPPRALSDDELDNVAGGCGGGETKEQLKPYTEKGCIVAHVVMPRFRYKVVDRKYEGNKVMCKIELIDKSGLASQIAPVPDGWWPQSILRPPV